MKQRTRSEETHPDSDGLPESMAEMPDRDYLVIRQPATEAKRDALAEMLLRFGSGPSRWRECGQGGAKPAANRPPERGTSNK